MAHTAVNGATVQVVSRGFTPAAHRYVTNSGFEGLLRGPGVGENMDIERETIVEIAVSTTATLLFVIAVVFIGNSNGAADLTSDGAVGLIAAIFGFILLMTVVGAFLDRQ